MVKRSNFEQFLNSARQAVAGDEEVLASSENQMREQDLAEAGVPDRQTGVVLPKSKPEKSNGSKKENWLRRWEEERDDRDDLLAEAKGPDAKAN